MYVIQINSKDDLLIGPFNSYEQAEEFVEDSVFKHDEWEIRAVVPPRADHRAQP